MTVCSRQPAQIALRTILLLAVGCEVLLFWTLVQVGPAYAQDNPWTEPVKLSNVDVVDADGSVDAWFPDLVIDSLGNIHVIWSQTTHLEEGGDSEQLFYTVWNGESWSEPSDIVPPAREIIRSAIAIDRDDYLQLVYRYRIKILGRVAAYYSQAPAKDAWSAAAWSPRRLVAARGQSYASDVALDSAGVLHVVFDDTGHTDSDVCPGCKDVYYRQSRDKGLTWSQPLNLAPMPMNASRPHLEIDSGDTIHVTWDEGPAGAFQGEPMGSVYILSTDGGLSWQQPITVTYPVSSTAQLTPGADGRGGVMLVWRVSLRDYNGIYYQWSEDQGETWSGPMSIPGIYSRPSSGAFDMYDMAADSAGHLHLVVVGRLSQDIDAPLGLYHLEWDGTSWSSPQEIFLRESYPAYPEWASSSSTQVAPTVAQQGLSPEYPKIEISEGNQLHVVWFTRRAEGVLGGHNVWYSRSESQAPHEKPLTRPTPTATPVQEPTAEQILSGLETPTPIQIPGADQFPEGIYTEYDELLDLALALSPLVVIGAFIWVFKRNR